MASRSEHKMKMREEARRKKKGPNMGVTGGVEYRKKIAQGRKELLDQAPMGGGDAAAARIEAELRYLLNHYVPTNNARIETLIDKWRRSGDPAYNPNIRIEFRKARQKHMRDAQPM